MDNQEQNIQTPADPLKEQVKATTGKNSTKKVVYTVLIVLVLAGAVLGYEKLRQKQEQDRKAKTASVTGAKKEIDTTQEERKVLEAQVSDYKVKIDRLPKDVSAEERSGLYIKLAAAQYKLGDYKDAINSLDAIIADNASNHRVWTMYTNIYWDMQDFVKAREASEKALDLDRENPQSWLAFIELQDNQEKSYIDSLYQDAIKRTDKNIDVVVAYAKFLEKAGDKQGAIAQWEEAGKINIKKKTEYQAEIGRLQQQ